MPPAEGTCRAPILILSPPFLLGLLLLAYALLGPRRDAHPHCRRCDFDLSARAPDSPRCPECGADLSHPRATRPARRRKRPIPLITGSLLILLPLAAVTALAVGTARGVYWNGYKPVWLLLVEHDDAALAEVFSRARSGQLGDAQVRRVSAAAVAAQADRSATWHPIWATILSQLHTAHQLPDADWQRYVRQAMDPPRLLARPRVARDGTLPALVELTGHVGGLTPLYAGVRRVSLTLDDVPLDPYPDNDTRSYSVLDNRPYVRHETYAELGKRVASLADGPHTLRMSVEWRVLDGTAQRFDRPADATGRAILQSTIELLPAGGDHVELITDDALRAAVESSLTLGPSRPTPRLPAALHIAAGDYERPSLYLEANNPPVGLAFTVTARDPASGREFPFVENWVWGSGYAASPNRGDELIIAGSLDGLDADRVDLILRPSPERATKTPDLHAIWGREITLKNVPVQWDPGARRPTVVPDDQRPRAPTTRRSRRPATRTTHPSTLQAAPPIP